MKKRSAILLFGMESIESDRQRMDPVLPSDESRRPSDCCDSSQLLNEWCGPLLMWTEANRKARFHPPKPLASSFTRKLRRIAAVQRRLRRGHGAGYHGEVQ